MNILCLDLPRLLRASCPLLLIISPAFILIKIRSKKRGSSNHCEEISQKSNENILFKFLFENLLKFIFFKKSERNEVEIFLHEASAAAEHSQNEVLYCYIQERKTNITTSKKLREKN